MKRRAFIHLSFLGIFKFPEDFPLQVEAYKKMPLSWLNDYLKVIDSDERNLFFLSPADETVFEKAFLPFEQNHYKILSEHFYEVANQVYIPIVLENKAAQLFDIQLLCFAFENNVLHYQTSLSSFDLEIISSIIIPQEIVSSTILKNPKLFKEIIKSQVKISENHIETSVFMHEKKINSFESNHRLGQNNIFV